jgi:hypothetical protein
MPVSVTLSNYGVSPKRIANNMATASAVNSSRVCVGDIDHMGG